VVDEHAYADLVGLCQILPGPASSQVGFSIGLMRAGYPGALTAWTGFTLRRPRSSSSSPTAPPR
jgi:chromate transporter